jgi:predicted amidohydrolase
MSVKIAVVQFEIAQYAPEENLAKAEHFVREAATAGADLIVFPEDFVVGPLNGRVDYADFEQRYVRHFQRLAARYRLDIVPGSIIEGDETGLYNTAYSIDREGSIRGRYRKVNLWLPERSYVTPGSEIAVFKTRFGKAGLIICWDLMFPEIFREMVRVGVELVLCPSYWCLEDAGPGQQLNPRAEILLVNALCTTRAFENEVILVYANAAGSAYFKDGSKATLIGQSQITVPFKGALSACPHNDEAMLIQEVDTAILRIAEQAYEIRNDLRTGRLGCLPQLTVRSGTS